MKKFLMLTVCITMFEFGSEKQIKAYEATVVDNKNHTTKVVDFKSNKYDYCKGLRYYTLVSTKTHFAWDFLPLKTNEYYVNIPFSIIEKVDIQKIRTKYLRYNLYRVQLADGTILQGELKKGIKYFTGKTDTGLLKVSKYEIKKITFKHKSQINFSEKPIFKSKRIISLILSTGQQINIENAAFILETHNKNGCYTGSTTQSYLFSKTDSSEYSIEWQKFVEFYFIPSRNGFDTYFNLVTKKGPKLKGRTVASNLLGIGGIGKIGAYKLLLIVPFNQPMNTKAKKIIFK